MVSLVWFLISNHLYIIQSIMSKANVIFMILVSIAIKTKKVFWRNWADGSCIYVNNFISNSLYRTKAAEHNEKQLWFNTKKSWENMTFSRPRCWVCFSHLLCLFLFCTWNFLKMNNTFAKHCQMENFSQE